MELLKNKKLKSFSQSVIDNIMIDKEKGLLFQKEETTIYVIPFLKKRDLYLSGYLFITGSIVMKIEDTTQKEEKLSDNLKNLVTEQYNIIK